MSYLKTRCDFPDDTVVKNLPVNSGDAREVDLIYGWGKFPGVGSGNPLQCSAWNIPWTEEPGRLFHGVEKRCTLSIHTHTHTHTHTHAHTQWQDFKIPEFMEFLDDHLRIWMFYVSLTAQCNNKLKKNWYVHYMKMCFMKKFLWLCGKWEFFMLDRLIFWKYMAASFICIWKPVISIYYHTRYYGILYSLPTVFINFSSRGEDYVHSKSSYN